MIRGLILLGPLILVGAIGSLVAIGGRGEDAAFSRAERQAKTITRPDVERAVLASPEPVPKPKTKARRSRCRPGERGELKNPWGCTVTYGSGRRFSYEVELRADGSYRGESADGTRIITGCCVERSGE